MVARRAVCAISNVRDRFVQNLPAGSHKSVRRAGNCLLQTFHTFSLCHHILALSALVLPNMLTLGLPKGTRVACFVRAAIGSDAEITVDLIRFQFL